MATYQLNVNGQRKQVNVDPSTPLLWVLREELKMTGTKYGCGISACGACTVHLDGVATRSCVVPVSLIGDRSIVTIEGIGADPVGQVVQDAWVDKDVVQCGYCQRGQIMSAVDSSRLRPSRLIQTLKNQWAAIFAVARPMFVFARRSRARHNNSGEGGGPCEQQLDLQIIRKLIGEIFCASPRLLPVGCWFRST